jgi:hypothetical protein
LLFIIKLPSILSQAQPNTSQGRRFDTFENQTVMSYFIYIFLNSILQIQIQSIQIRRLWESSNRPIYNGCCIPHLNVVHCNDLTCGRTPSCIHHICSLSCRGMLSKSSSMAVCKEFRNSISFKRQSKLNGSTAAPLKIVDHTLIL